MTTIDFKKWLGLTLLCCLAMASQGQSGRHVIRFRDKGTNPFTLSNPSAYLSQKAIDRRTRYNLTLDSTDLPVTPRYIDSIRLAGNVTILNVSKWLNAVTIQTTDDAALARINSFPFVVANNPVAPRLRGGTQEVKKYSIPFPLPPFYGVQQLMADHYNYGNSYNQVHLHHGEFLHNIGLRGNGMVIGMLDAGYQNYLTVSSLDSARSNGQILGIQDLVARDGSVNEDNSHGMQCLSVIAALLPGQFVGTAPKASFYLFRTEDAATEYPIEEYNWVSAAEKIDSAGGDVISSSLGYNTFDGIFAAADYSYAQLDGNTAVTTIGADLAARKGLLMVNSAGNLGNSPWKKIVAPADGDSVLAVGAVSSVGVPASFTSHGPSSDGRVKPNVAAHGLATTVQLPNNVIGTNNGTSFAAPNMAGLATCLWQGFPEVNNMKIISVLQAAGNRASTPNDTTGYGIPDVRKAFMQLLKEHATASATPPSISCKVNLSFQSKDIRGMRYEIERKNPDGSTFLSLNGILNFNATRSTFGVSNYTITDSLVEVTSGTIQYRIKQIIDTSASGYYADYIDTVSVASTIACLHTSIDPINPLSVELSLRPNPALNDSRLVVSTVNAITDLYIQVFDGKGRNVWAAKRSKGTGAASFELPASSWAQGKYYVSVYDGSKLLGTRELLRL